MVLEILVLQAVAFAVARSWVGSVRLLLPASATVHLDEVELVSSVSRQWTQRLQLTVPGRTAFFHGAPGIVVVVNRIGHSGQIVGQLLDLQLT